MVFPIPTSLELQLTAGDVTCNCCNGQANPEDSYVVPKDYIPPSLLTKMLYPNRSRMEKEEEDKKVYAKLEEYLAKKVGVDRAVEILGDKQFPLRLRNINEKRAIAEREVLRKLVNEQQNPEPLLEIKPPSSASKDAKPLSVDGEYPGPFKTAILAGKIERTTEASPEQIQEITRNIELTLKENFSDKINSTVIRSLLVNELRQRHIKVKKD